MQTTADINSLVGQDLSGFKVLVMTEVFKVDDDGRRSKSIGYFKDVNIAQAFAGFAASPSQIRRLRLVRNFYSLSGNVAQHAARIRIFTAVD